MFYLRYDIFRNKSYQLKEPGISTVVTKITGTGYTYEPEIPFKRAKNFRPIDPTGTLFSKCSFT